MVAKILWWALLAYMILYGCYYFYDLWVHRHEFEKDTSAKHCALFGFIFLFFDVLGIGSFAPQTTVFHHSHQVEDKLIPGTLNAGNAIPTILQALIFISLVQVDSFTLFTMIASSTLGSILGASIVSQMSEKKIQLSMGLALMMTAFFMFASAIGILDLGGQALGLEGVKLIIGVTINFILGALMTVGVGLYSPCMALVSILGMSPTVAFPVMMGSCAFLMPTCGIIFIKENMYNRKASLMDTIFGSMGVLVAAYIVKSLPLDVLRWGVVIVVCYTAIQMLRSGLKK